MRPEPRQIWLADLGIAAKTRPVIIVSRRDDQAPRDLVIFVSCTSQSRPGRYEVALPDSAGLDRETWANVQGIGSIPTARLIRRIGNVPAETWENLQKALRFALEL